MMTEVFDIIEIVSYATSFLLWTALNTFVCKVARSDYKSRKFESSHALRLCLPLAELIAFVVKLFFDLPLCYFSLCPAICHFLCQTLFPTILATTRSVVIYTTLFILLDRYQVIKDPVQTGRRYLTSIGFATVFTLIWLLGLVVSIAQLLSYGSKSITLIPAFGTSKVSVLQAQMSAGLAIATNYLIPQFVMLPLTYFSIRNLKSANVTAEFRIGKYLRAQYYLLATTLVNLITWTPYYLHLLLATMKPELCGLQTFAKISDHIVFWSFPVNALLYWGMHPLFFSSIRQMFLQEYEPIN